MAALDTNIFISEILETGTDSGDGLTFEFYVTDRGDIVDSSTVGYTFDDPLVYINGVLQVAGYTVNADSITFSGSQTGNTITMTYTWQIDAALVEDTSVFEFEHAPNISVELDVNAKRKITMAPDKVQIIAGALGWESLSETQYEIIAHIYETEDTTFAIERGSFTDTFEYAYIDRLMIITAPRLVGIPGQPNCYDVNIEVVQVEDAA